MDTTNTPQLTPQEMVSNLTTLKNSITDRMRTFNGKTKETDDQLVQVQNQAIETLFKTLEENGVNLNDQNSVTAFLQNLKEVNPNGYDMFEAAVDNLMQEKGDLNKMQPPVGFSEPLNPMQQLSVEPGSPSGPANNVPGIPSGPVDTSTEQATPQPPQIGS